MVVEDDGTTFIDSRETYFVYYTFPIDEIFTLGFIGYDDLPIVETSCALLL